MTRRLWYPLFSFYFGTFCRRISFCVGECIWNMYLRVPVHCATSWCRMCKFELVSEPSRALQGMSLLVHFQRNKYVTLYRLAAVTFHALLTLLSTLKTSVIVVIVICGCHGSSISFWRGRGCWQSCVAIIHDRWLFIKGVAFVTEASVRQCACGECNRFHKRALQGQCEQDKDLLKCVLR